MTKVKVLDGEKLDYYLRAGQDGMYHAVRKSKKKVLSRRQLAMKWLSVKWQNFVTVTVRIIKITSVCAAIVGVLAFISWFAFNQGASKVTYAAPVEKIVKDNTLPPILVKIAKCESGGSQFDRNGQVIINKTLDAGKFQINVAIWGKKAHDMGLNLMNEKDNETFAIWLYENHGTDAWSASRKCWSK